MVLPVARDTSTAVVTGASSGIGRALVRELARRGFAVVPVARRAGPLQALVEELGARTSVRPVVADLATSEGRGRLDDELDRAAVLVNCAGTGPVGTVAAGRRRDELACVEVNAAAVVELSSRVLPGMIERGTGAILNVSSTSAFMPVPGQAVYAASKAFVLSYTEALRREVRATGVTVSALCPGPVRTGLAAANGTTDARLFAGLPEAMILSPETVAAAGVDGLDHDRGVVVPGRLNAAMAVAARFLPRRLVMAAVAANAPGLAAAGPGAPVRISS